MSRGESIFLAILLCAIVATSALVISFQMEESKANSEVRISKAKYLAELDLCLYRDTVSLYDVYSCERKAQKAADPNEN